MTETLTQSDSRRRVIVVMNQFLFADLLARYLSSEAGYNATAHTHVKETEIPFIPNQIALIDYTLYSTNISKQEKIDFEREIDSTQIILMVDQGRVSKIIRRLPNNVRGLIPYDLPVRRLRSMIDHVASGETVFPYDFFTQDEASKDAETSLSSQEKLVLRILALGYSNKDISKELGIRLPTVKMHVSSILRKLGCQNRSQAAIFARENTLG